MKRASLVVGADYLIGGGDWLTDARLGVERVIVLALEPWVILKDTYGGDRSNGAPRTVKLPNGETTKVTHLRPAFGEGEKLTRGVLVAVMDSPDSLTASRVTAVPAVRIRQTWLEGVAQRDAVRAEREAARTSAEDRQKRETDAVQEVAARLHSDGYTAALLNLTPVNGRVSIPVALFVELAQAAFDAQDENWER